MIHKISFRKGKVLFLLGVSIYLQACGGTRMVNVDSVPSGANVIADGKHIGTTPMQFSAEEVFPAHWYSGSYMVKGSLELEKEGCNKMEMSVNDFVLSKDINKTLDCKQDLVIKEGAEAPVVDSSSTKTEKDVEERLNQLKDIYEKDLITKEEYQEQRLRILNQL